MCATTLGLLEANTAADPRILQNNDFWYVTTPTALYRDENANDLSTIALVNARSEITSADNISADPRAQAEARRPSRASFLGIPIGVVSWPLMRRDFDTSVRARK